MSPISPVFHAVVTLTIGLKTQLEWGHPFHKTNCTFETNTHWFT